MFKIAGLFILLYLSLPGTGTQSVNLPGDQFFVGWSSGGEKEVYHKNDLYGYINGGAELFLEFGFQKLIVGNYAKNGSEITVELYAMSDAAGALGIYLMKKGIETTDPGIRARNSTNRYQSTVVKGNFYLQVNNFSGNEAFLPVMIEMANFIVEQIPDQPLDVFDILPREGLVLGSERIIRGPYALQPLYTFGEGDVLSLRQSKGAVCAEYTSETDEHYRNMIITYSDNISASEAWVFLRSHLDPHISVQSESVSFIDFTDYRDQYGQILIRDSYIIIVFNRKNPISE